MSNKDLVRLAEIVREITGNDIQEKNHSMLQARIYGHMLKIGCTTMEQYWDHYQNNVESEKDLLQSLMTTHYTFFFREFVHFETLDLWLNQNMGRLRERYKSEGRGLRIWSAACSRGQEVYSLAMFLDSKVDIPYEIVGSDIDAKSVEYAENGVYPIKEVNTIPHEYLSRFWKKGTGPVKEFAAVKPALKSKTKFCALNLLMPETWTAMHAKVDVIFCRNVFIYFSEDNVQKAAQSLASRLEPGGLFVSGLSEPVRFSGWLTESIGPSCYVKPLGIKSSPVASAPADSKRPEVVKAPRAVPAASTEATSKPCRVLCVDDSGIIQSLMKRIFAADPYFGLVEFAGNGKIAREKLDVSSYDLITLDIHMPEVGGIEFLEKFYKRNQDPPVLMVSSVSRTDIELASKSLALGAYDYVEKPAMNNLEKSIQEIHTKAKMAIRSRGSKAAPIGVGGFDESIAQKIVIPDASQCLRLVVAGNSSIKELEQIIRGQDREYRSPPLLVLWHGDAGFQTFQTSVLNWTQRHVHAMRSADALLRPNQIYTGTTSEVKKIVTKDRFKLISLQILDPGHIDFAADLKGANVQVLFEENIAGSIKEFQHRTQLRVSEATPSTSFCSLSVEYFANLRKAAA